MPDYAMLGSMGSAVIGEVTDHSLRKTQYEMEVDAKSYREEMAAISKSMQMNNLTKAEANLSDQARRATVGLAKQELEDRGAAEVSAAAAGVAGGSVAATMRGLERSSLNANAARTKNYESALAASTANRKNITMQAIFNKDVNPLQIPNASDALLGMTQSVVEIWDDNQPEGHKSTDKISSLWSWATKGKKSDSKGE